MKVFLVLSAVILAWNFVEVSLSTVEPVKNQEYTNIQPVMDSLPAHQLETTEEITRVKRCCRKLSIIE